ncbi:MAG TPA: hypothetical protein VG963_28630 [Polyangiaceae bacterium]|nr:hypothetical protein [Polyangiaceae bacterium]
MRHIILAVLMLAGCATRTETYLPDGTKGYTLNCSGAALTWNACLERAGKTCGSRGYEILDRREENGASVGGSQFGVFGGTTVTRTMVVKCK